MLLRQRPQNVTGEYAWLFTNYIKVYSRTSLKVNIATSGGRPGSLHSLSRKQATVSNRGQPRRILYFWAPIKDRPPYLSSMKRRFCAKVYLEASGSASGAEILLEADGMAILNSRASWRGPLSPVPGSITIPAPLQMWWPPELCSVLMTPMQPHKPWCSVVASYILLYADAVLVASQAP